MSLFIAATWVAALVLVLAGARKVVLPTPAIATLRAARLPSGTTVVRALGAGEVAVGLAVLVGGGTVSTGALAAAYSALAIFAYAQRRSGADCGCFGTTGTPLTALHVWLDAIVAAAAAVAATQPTPSLFALIAERPAAGLTAGVLVVVAANLIRLLLTALPDLTAARGLLEPDGTA